jgi:hypothetical protein
VGFELTLLGSDAGVGPLELIDAGVGPLALIDRGSCGDDDLVF